MMKRSLTAVIFLFLLVILVLSYISYSIYCQTKINEFKNDIVTANKQWNNYFSLVNKVNSKELSYISNSPKLIELLHSLEISLHQNSLNDINANIALIEDYTYNKLSNDIDLIVIYTNDGIIRAGFEKESDEIPFVNLPEVVTKVLDGQATTLNINLKGNLYYANFAPVSRNNKVFGAILIGKQINNSVAAYVRELTNVYLVAFTKDKLISTSLPLVIAEKLFNQFRQLDPVLTGFINNTSPAQASYINYLESVSSDFWAAGDYIVDNNSGYMLLVPNSRIIRPYLIMKDNIMYIALGAVVLAGLISLLLSRIITSLIDIVNIKAVETSERFSVVNKTFNKTVDKHIDGILNRVLSLLNLEFFRTNKELQEVSNTFFTMVKDYKAKMLLENFSSNPNVNKMISSRSSNSCTVNTRTVTMYYSNVKEFTQLMEFFSPARAFTLLSIYLRIQHEIIQKYNGKILKQTDDRLVAVFENANHARDAISASFEIQNTLHKLSSVNPENIELSVAVSSGEVVSSFIMDQETYIGTATKVGEKFCNETPAGWIYVSQYTYDLAGVEELDARQDMLVVKGIKNPVQFFKFDPDAIIINVTREIEDKVNA